MRVRVAMRINSSTGEMEEFLVEDISVNREPEHDETHDRIAYEVGKVVERRPSPQQVVQGPSTAEALLTYRPGDEGAVDNEREKASE